MLGPLKSGVGCLSTETLVPAEGGEHTQKKHKLEQKTKEEVANVRVLVQGMGAGASSGHLMSATTLKCRQKCVCVCSYVFVCVMNGYM